MVRSLLAQQTVRGIEDAVLLAQQIRICVQGVLQIGRPSLFTSDVKKNVRHAFSPTEKEAAGAAQPRQLCARIA